MSYRQRLLQGVGSQGPCLTNMTRFAASIIARVDASLATGVAAEFEFRTLFVLCLCRSLSASRHSPRSHRHNFHSESTVAPALASGSARWSTGCTELAGGQVQKHIGSSVKECRFDNEYYWFTGRRENVAAETCRKTSWLCKTGLINDQPRLW